MSKEIYLIHENEYAAAGNFSEVIEAHDSKEKAESRKKELEERQTKFKEKFPHVDSCITYGITDIMLYETDDQR